MKIISWNCNMAFRKKYTAILKLKPDLLFLQECEHLDKILPLLSEYKIKDYDWFGENKHKGTAIINFSEFALKRKQIHNLTFRYIVPYRLETPNPIDFFSIWAMDNKSNRSKSYIGQIWQALNYYEFSKDFHSVLIGDFNSNAIWDNERKKVNHTNVVEYLKNKTIVSLYHQINEEESGKETSPTWYMYKHRDKQYHLDYCFASISLIRKGTTIEIGDYDEWIEFSDHMPIIVKNLG